MKEMISVTPRVATFQYCVYIYHWPLCKIHQSLFNYIYVLV